MGKGGSKKKSQKSKEASKQKSSKQKQKDRSQEPSTSRQHQPCSSKQQQQALQDTPQEQSSSGTQQQKTTHDTQQQQSTRSTQQQQVLQGSEQTRPSRGTQQQRSPHDTQQQQILQGTPQAELSRGTQQPQSKTSVITLVYSPIYTPKVQSQHDTQEQQSPHGGQQQQVSQVTPQERSSSGTQQQQTAHGTQQQQVSQPTQQAWPSRGTQQQQPPHGIQQQQSPHGSQQQQITHGMQQLQVSQGLPQAWPSHGAQQQQSPHGIQQQQPPQGTQQAWPSRGTQQQQVLQGTPQAWPSRGAQQQQSPHGTQQQQPPHGIQQQQSPHGIQQQQPPHGTQQQQITHGTQQQQVSQGTPQAWPSRGAQQQQSPHGTQQQQPPHGTQQQQPPHGIQQQQPPHGTQQQQITHGTQQQQVSQGTQQAWPSRGAQQQQSPHGTQQQQPPHGTQQQQPPHGIQQQQPPHGTQQQQITHGTQQQQVSQGTQQAWSFGGAQQQQLPSGSQQQQLPCGSQQQQLPCGTQQQQPPRGTQQALSLIRTKKKSTHDTKKQCLLSYENTKVLVPIRPWPRGTHQAWPTTPVPSDAFKTKESVEIKTVQDYSKLIPLKTSRSGGQVGRKIIVETNMLKLNFPKNFQARIIHYDVDIVPDKPKCFLRFVFEEFRKIHCPNRYPAFDGRKNAYSANDLPFGNESKVEEIDVFDKEHRKNRTFKICLKKVSVLDLSWLKSQLTIENFDNETKQKCIQALDVILRHGPAYKYTTVGRSLFQPPEGRVVSLSNGLDLWIGIFQSVIIGSKPYLNVDVAHKGFPTEQPVINLMKEFCKNPRSDVLPADITAADIKRNGDKITKFLKGLKVQYELPGQPTTKRTYNVNGLVPSPRENKFYLSDGTSCTVEQYFLKAKKYKIKHNDLPCLWVGSRSTNIHVPPELCTVVAGQVQRKKMNDIQTSKMIREAATDTKKRKQKILEGFAKMDVNHQPTLVNEFHFSVQGEFEKVPARVLQAPMLEYHEKNINVQKGTWRADKFLNPCTLPDNSWTILNLDGYVRDPDLYNLQSKLQQCGKSLNMNINKPQTPFRTLRLQRDSRNIQEYFMEKKQQSIKLVIVILPYVEYAYSVVKQISEIHIIGGIVTQCIRQQTLKRLSDSTIGNILLKINSKLNGINHKLALSHRPPCLDIPCMIVGADVTHPSPDAVNIPSIAAVAASHDPNAFQYNVEIRLQSPREEIIADLKQIMIKQLVYFYQRTGHKPRRLIFYRDGVSEGQLAQVINYELFAIKEAIAQLENTKTCMVPITFLVVQKRHHIRLFPTDMRNSDDRNFNVQAGTIVDSEITHPTQIDFYLVSHASIQGTARPTKYRCIWNENGMHEDEIEELTYYLCHLFARCTRSVSYPAPTYYAHLAAFRARALIHNVDLDLTNLQKEQDKKLNLQLNENSPMFFV
ncbi:protein argonaute-2 [Frieseomelitta varia]|uniref:protein argonaute-2 n=1 Tax=Frieseomelitta varia TaxID=561572 RepID=UPI001CB6A627|nr:protein argonaute-2 [Frieseomelitta varia]